MVHEEGNSFNLLCLKYKDITFSCLYKKTPQGKVRPPDFDKGPNSPSSLKFPLSSRLFENVSVNCVVLKKNQQ